MAFADTWNAVQTNLTVGTVIPNWTIHSGAVGDPFTIAAVTTTTIVVDTPGAQTAQSVPRSDFEVVYDRWDDNCHGAMPRSDFTPLTRYSKYVISILHWLEGRTSGRLP
jgi:hypothetical protein